MRKQQTPKEEDRRKIEKAGLKINQRSLNYGISQRTISLPAS
jgi:hypothetical protein